MRINNLDRLETARPESDYPPPFTDQLPSAISREYLCVYMYERRRSPPKLQQKLGENEHFKLD